MPLTPKDVEALVRALRYSEKVKPSQQAKRNAFEECGIDGGYKDRVLTAIFYDTLKRIGIIDKIICELTGVKDPAILDPWLRAALRAAVELLVFERFIKESKYKDLKPLLVKYFKTSIAKKLSTQTHPYVGMHFWELVDKLATYKWTPKDLYDSWEYKYMISRFIIDKIVCLLGPREAKLLLREFNRVYPISIRVNTLKVSVEEVIEVLKGEGIQLERGRYVPTIIKIHGPYNFNKSELYREGKIVIQEEAAALAAVVLDPKPGEVVVDMCAAPGGKTEHIAELMGNKGVIHAFDVSKPRIERMRALLKRCGITIAEIHEEDARKAPSILGEEVADKVLVDVPCTASGTIMRNQELRWRIRRDSIEKATRLQYEILKAAVKLVKRGGRILYTTCSLFKEENEDIIKKVLEESGEGLRVVPLKGPLDEGFLPGTMRAWPHRHKTIGFFYALLEKVA